MRAQNASFALFPSAAFAAFLLAWTSLAPTGRAAPAKPNIVVILADDMGYGDPRCYNPQSKCPTPHIDRLAREGMCFVDAHTPASVCTPTRYGILTGRYPWRSRLKRGVLGGYSPALIEPGRVTLPEYLRRKGYVTYGVGKWHLGLQNQRTDYAKPLRPGPLTVGFDHYFGIPASLDMAPYLFFRDDRPVEMPTDQTPASKQRRFGSGGFWRAGAIAPHFSHEQCLPELEKEALRILEAQKPGRPFFLYFALSAPHTPWMPRPQYWGRSGAGWYGDFVVQVDDVVGAVLRVLDERGLAENTLLIFTSDNGAHWLPSDIERFGHRANGLLRGQKADIWEGGHRVPFIVRWPGKVRPKTVSKALLCQTDIFRTVADWFGEAAPGALPEQAAEDSVSFLPVLQGRMATARKSVVHQAVDGTLAIRVGSWKLCPKLGSHGFSSPKKIKPKPGGPEGQLYNLAEDLAETRNLWNEEPDLRAKLAAELQRAREAQGTAERAALR